MEAFAANSFVSKILAKSGGEGVWGSGTPASISSGSTPACPKTSCSSAPPCASSSTIKSSPSSKPASATVAEAGFDDGLDFIVDELAHGGADEQLVFGQAGVEP